MSELLKKHNKNSIGLIGHTIVNYPSPELARQAVDVMVEQGVSLIELQIPFSEPVADGPLFMRANFAALDQGVTVERCFECMHEVSAKHAIPFVFMSYANILFKRGYKNFITAATEAGAKGIIVPDLPVDNGDEFIAICKQYDFAAIQVIPPNISSARLALLARAASGFIYVVARSGVTGTKTDFSQTLITFLAKIREHTDLPIAVGFGVSTPEDVAILKSYADYAIVGSQALRVLQAEDGLKGYSKFWQDMYAASI